MHGGKPNFRYLQRHLAEEKKSYREKKIIYICINLYKMKTKAQEKEKKKIT